MYQLLGLVKGPPKGCVFCQCFTLVRERACAHTHRVNNKGHFTSTFMEIIYKIMRNVE